MVKQHKRVNKSKTNSKSRSKSNSRSKSRSMKGGDGSGGRVPLPPSYFNNTLDGYFAPGSPELNPTGKQYAVSQGTIWSGGEYAGPNLFPMKGGNCGCKKQKNSKRSKTNNKSKSSKRKNMNRKSKKCSKH